MLVKEIMNHNYPFMYEDELATKARAVLRERNLRVLPIVDEKKRLVGTLSRRNIMTITSSISPLRITGIMANPPFVATVDMDALQALKEMNRFDKWYVAVAKSQSDRTYIGMLGLENFIEALLKKKSPKLLRPVSEIMTRKIVTCSPDDEIDNVWRKIQEHKFAACPIVTQKKLVGIVTQTNMLENSSFFPTFEAKKGRFKTPSKVSSIMETSMVSLTPDSTVKEAAELLLKKNIGRLPVTDKKGELIGIVDREDVARALT